MKNLNLIIILIIIIFISLSCKKDNNQDTPTDDKFIHCKLNPFLPIDTNRIWIYNKKITTYDDIINDGIDETTTTNVNDTTTFSKEYLKDKYLVRRFNESFYFTNENSISILLDSSFFLNDITFVTLAYTSKTDTTWKQTIYAKNTTVELTFKQSLNLSKSGQEELLINVKNGEFLTIYQSYVFKKNVGLIKRRINVMNMEIEYNLLKTL